MLGELLGGLRASRELSVAQVIEALGVPRSTFYWWESANSRPEPEHLQMLLDLYDASPDQRLRAWELRAARQDPPPLADPAATS